MKDTESASPGLSYASGFHAQEQDEAGAFRWMQQRGRLVFPPRDRPRFLELSVLSEFGDLSQTLTLRIGAEVTRRRLLPGWSLLSVAVPAGVDAVALEAAPLLPATEHPGDSRALSVRVRTPRLYDDPARHGHLIRRLDNEILNREEMLAGRTMLSSTPPRLGIDLHGRCNVKPPCVYCEWDDFKTLEGANVDAPATEETFAEWGDFFEYAKVLVNCSIGEPFLRRDLGELLTAFDARDQVLELTTNGQIMSDEQISALMGRRIRLYVSLDAGTRETYARLRNDTFERVLENLRRLMLAKGGRGGWPELYLVFIPLRVNVDELEEFVRLCARLDVDRMILRPAFAEKSIALDWMRAGYRFDYADELLSGDALARVSARAARLCREHGVPLSDQMDFGDPVQARGADTPLCTEPWETNYVLRRGVMPCCYGRRPVADMADHREAWNAPEIQAIRRDLARGQLSSYCKDSPSCPIVRRLGSEADANSSSCRSATSSAPGA